MRQGPQTSSARLQDDLLTVECLPEQGCTIVSIADRRSGAEALWRWDRSPAACARSLGPAGAASIATFVDVFAGGWFTMFPAAGFPVEDDETSLLHGELVRLPWETHELSESALVAGVETIRSPFAIERRIDLADGAVTITDRIANRGSEEAHYAFGHHPCLSRETFAGGRLELDAKHAEVPDPPYDDDASVLASGAIEWPAAATRRGEAIDAATVPLEADGRVDHVCFASTSGRARVTAPRHGAAFELSWDAAALPHLLLWQNFRGLGGWPFWGSADTFAVELVTVPGRTMQEALDVGALSTLAPGASVEFAATARWESA